MGLFSSAKDFLKKSVSKVVRSPIMDAIPGGSILKDFKLGIESQKDADRYAKAVRKSQPDPIPMWGPGGNPFAATGGTVMPGAGSMSALVPIGGIIAKGAVGLVRGAAGKILRVITPTGQSVSRRKAAAYIKRFGFEAGAVALGITAIEAAQLLLDDASTPRRRKGISYAQLRNAKRVACTISRMARDLNVKPAPARRRTSCR